ncbi:MAG: fibronectin type III domain-containing protein [Candidatus Sumerlaeaceae bacterium]|nr:fibronectin type III domain-containing protein [Candidatus Sumerlaeaceae bacterium]
MFLQCESRGDGQYTASSAAPAQKVEDDLYEPSAGNAAPSAVAVAPGGESADPSGKGGGAASGGPKKAFVVNGPPSISNDFINFGYLQNDSILPHMRWNALTHIGTTFISFNSTGNWVNLSSFTGRDASLKAGGAAENAGVKVILVALNSGFDSAVTNAVMQSATNRTTLVNNVVSAVTSDAYCQGVSFDFEPFSYGTATRDGMVLFFQELRNAFNASSKPNAEISLYTDATYSSSNYNIPGLVPNIDYFNYSCYDWATGSTAHAVSDTDNYVSRVNTFLNVGIPPNKMVLLDSSYGGDWPSCAAAAYNTTGGSRTAIGFCDGLFDTTLNTANGGPFAANYQTGDEAGWYAYVSASQHVATWEDPRAAEYKIRLIQSFQDSGNTNSGKRLRGVGWWSLYWFANFTTSYNPLPPATPQGNTSKTRTYPQIYQLCQEILSPPATTKYVFEKFEQDNPRWASFASTQSSSPDNTNWLSASTTKALIASPSGSGTPVNSTKAMDLHFAFSGSSAGKIFFRHEVLKDNNVTAVVDTNAMAAKFDANNAVNAYVYSAGAYTGLTVRPVVMDKNRQLEAGPAVAMNSTGWRTLTWDLTDTTAGNITGLTTAEPAFTNGNGTIDTAGAGARDIGFVGFLVEKAASGSTTGDLYFDELSYEHKNPGGKNYKINEFRYAGNANEFLEIVGPAGGFPANLELRFYNPTNGSVLSSVALGGQTVPANGFFVVADPNVTVGGGATKYTPAAWTDTADNMANSTTQAGSAQLYDTVTGCVYDSVVYQARGGLADLIRQETHGVTAEGYPWIGEVSAGADASGAGHSMGRYPDGTDTNWNFADFSAQRATPGAANGAQFSLPMVFDCETAPTSGQPFTTFGTYGVTAPPAGIAHTGNAHRCVDATGGGTMTFWGDASLGSDGNGYNVSGDIYLQPSSARTAAQGIGFCGKQGTRFFTANVNNLKVSGYESGYWIVYENNNGLALNDDQADHGGILYFLHATNDNMGATKTTLLTSATLASVGLSGYQTSGGWTTFLLWINPNAAAGDRLIASVNGTQIYHGVIPAGGPISGAVMAGYREATGGTFANTDGTWVDNLVIASSAVPAAPSGLGATAVSQTQINLTWTDNSSNETGFIVGRGTTSGGPYTDIASVGANVTSYNNTTGLSANTTYYYVVRATNTGVDSANSAQASATTLPNAPSAPSGLGATAVSQTQINLSWTDNSSNETGFIIGRSTTSGGPYTDIVTVGAGVTTYNNTTGLSANTTYYYVVRATNTGGDSANSSQASATTLPNAPAAPSGLGATAISQTQINLSWTDNSSNETGFIIGRSTTSSGPYTDIVTVGAGVTSYNNNTGLSANTTYYYVVRATNTGGDSANSSEASATTLPNPPAAPSGLGATAVSQTQINLSWTDNSSNETGFIIGRSTTSGGPYTDIVTVGAGVTTYNNNTGLSANTTYYYVVRATNTGGDSANSSQASATTLPNAPAAPSGLGATAVSQTQINLSWTDNSSNETGFIIGRSTTSGGPYTDIVTVGAGVTTYNNNTGLSANTTYYYVVRATNTGGDSANSSQASATTLPNAPAAPSGLGATAISQTQINLSWTDNSSNETGFIIGRSTTSGGPYTDIVTVGAGVTTYNNNTGLSANTTYYYVVRATNTGGDSANSSQASATTLPNAPAAPSGLGATAVSQTQINLSWTDNSSNETGFIIGRSTTSGGPYTDIVTVGAGVTTYNNTTGLSANTTYYYVVRATNTGGDSANSSQASATTLPNAPAAPSGLGATAISQTQINLSWTDNSSNETGFIIGRSTTSGGPYTDIVTVGAGVTTYNNTTGLSAGTTYYYVVRATNTGGDSANSSQASATTLPNAPTAPSGLAASAVSSSQINLTWTDNSSNEANFVVARSNVSGGPYTDIVTLGANVTSYSNSGLNASTPYYYVVRATNAGGASANSAQASATTLQANRITNGSFENGFTGGVGNGWSSWTATGSAVLGFGQASLNKQDGAYSQYWNRADTAACDGGVYQTFSVVPGGTYQITGWMKRQSTFTGSFLKVGYDLTGGTNGTAASVTYTDITGGTDNVWVQYSQSVVATGATITVFSRGGHTGTTGGANAYFYFDAVTVVGPGPSLATNGSFENGFTGGVGNGWTSWISSGTPTFGQASANKQDGSYSQYWNRADTAVFDGGVRQTITVVPGQQYTIVAWMKRQSTLAGTSMKFGYDLTGGTNGTAASVNYTDITGGTNNVWVQYTANVVATGSSITLFARGGHTGTTGGTTSYFYVDAVKLYVP